MSQNRCKHMYGNTCPVKGEYRMVCDDCCCYKHDGTMTDSDKQAIKQIVLNSYDFCGSPTSSIKQYCLENGIGYKQNKDTITSIIISTMK